MGMGDKSFALSEASRRCEGTRTTMSIYRVRIPVEFTVEIDDSNREIDAPAALQGDTTLIAVRRALFYLFNSDLAKHDPVAFRAQLASRRKLGVGTIFVRGKWGDFPVEVVSEPEVTPATGHTDV